MRARCRDYEPLMAMSSPDIAGFLVIDAFRRGGQYHHAPIFSGFGLKRAPRLSILRPPQQATCCREHFIDDSARYHSLHDRLLAPLSICRLKALIFTSRVDVLLFCRLLSRIFDDDALDAP